MTGNIGVISSRIAGTDGVSLETHKWADVLGRLGYECFYMAGELDTPAERSFLSAENHFKHPDIEKIHREAFGNPKRSRALTSRIHKCRERIKDEIYRFIEQFNIDMILAENSLTIPMNLPLGMALTDVIAETNMMTIAHHHDFFWERKRFLHNCVWDLLNACFPPHLPSIKHVVINTSAQNQLALRTGIGARLIPNVMEFEKPPGGLDDYNRDVRDVFGIGRDQIFLLQPTRVVQRKSIEHAIEFTQRLGRDAVLVISHASGDEGYGYQERVKEYAGMLDVRALFVDDIIAGKRGTTRDGRKIYSIEDIYPHADIVTYPSITEGFGNAFLEAIYFKKPILVNNYSIYFHDIRPKGFDVIEMDAFISEQTVKKARLVLNDPDARADMVEKNYNLAMRYYSYWILKGELDHLITTFLGTHHAEE